MADKSVGELIATQSVTPTDLFVLEQNGTAKKLTGQVLENWLVSFADGHGGIHSIVKHSTDVLVDTYRITLADTTTFDFTVTNGKAISSVEQTSEEGLTRAYTIAFNDNTSQTFTVTDGRSITNIEKTATNVLTDTYTISYNDGSTSTFTVKNGKGISSFAKVSTVGRVDTYRIEYNDGTSDELTVTNGAKGDKGDNQYVWIKYASQKPTASSHSFGDVADNWIGIYSGDSATAPTDWTQYEWFQIKGEKGDTGSPATLVTKSVTYQVSDSGTIIPSGTWVNSVPVVSQGKYLWTKTELRFNTGDPIVSYSVARMGVDGSGSVSSVAGASPDATGNVPLTAADVGALAVSGGDMTGELRMNGQPISGLNDPTKDNQAARKGYVDTSVRKAAPMNLLDNSDFRNPVNQRGYVSGNLVPASAYFLDRWYNTDAGDAYPTFGASGIGNLVSDIQQNVDLAAYIGKPVTIVLYSDTDTPIYCASGMVTNNANWTVICAAANGACSVENNGTNQWNVAVGTDCKYVALYPGEFSLETVPDYQPKGYGAELAECQRYYYRIPAWGIVGSGITEWDGTSVTIAIPIGVQMRVIPSVPNTPTVYVRMHGLGTGVVISGKTPVTTIVGNTVNITYAGVFGDSTNAYNPVLMQNAEAPLELIADL